MEDLVLISIIVPVYNTGRFLKRCLDSCLSQTYQYVEIVAIDDGSTDNSLEILLDYSRKDQRVRVISKSNEGLILTRKHGVIEALGRYIFFLDSDDYIPQNSIEILFSALKSAKAKMVMGQAYYFWDDGKFALKNKYDPIGESDIELYASLMQGRIGGHIWGALIEKKIFDLIDFPKELIVGEDLALQMQLRYLTTKIVYIPDVVYYYYQNSGSIMHKQTEKILRSHLAFCKWQIRYVDTLSFKGDALIQGTLAYSVLNGLFTFIFNGGHQQEYCDYVKMVNSTYLRNRFAKANLPFYKWGSLYLNAFFPFWGTLLIRSLYYLRITVKR